MTAEPRVAPGESRVVDTVWGRAKRLPITMATAMVSPRARPIARVTAASMPERAPGITARFVTCQRVAPSARAASRSDTATPESAVRDRATTVGRIITASTTLASSRLEPSGAPAKARRPSTGSPDSQGST